ncbi:elongation factor P hydroxylase [Alkalimarinus alittae]|uniref:Elongation factor P hydroxylase n=1 Tax=Alkalimarinus alittae TaxID=2961619 RepID=A0ABY6MXY3_9ALTE|nr:elongation factor P hydroxylase [Alkalimarinus alittae]UZE94639.1 elongation factor P hydroxylase [Alkalimarinus alittae]
MPVFPEVSSLIALFNSCFKESENTILVKGDDEPIYLPATVNNPYNQVIFAHGYFSSALHEISHWCIAGKERRKKVDFGYWYEPDGRSIEQQQAFETVEIKPQALEWIFSLVSGIKFNLSADNLGGEVSPTADLFAQNVRLQALSYLSHGLPSNAAQFTDALITHFGTRDQLVPDAFELH